MEEKRLAESFPTHERSLVLVEQAGSNQGLKLLVDAIAELAGYGGSGLGPQTDRSRAAAIRARPPTQVRAGRTRSHPGQGTDRGYFWTRPGGGENRGREGGQAQPHGAAGVRPTQTPGPKGANPGHIRRLEASRQLVVLVTRASGRERRSKEQASKLACLGV
ncbi:unnamed protein product [Calypogeia fissa]